MREKIAKQVEVQVYDEPRGSVWRAPDMESARATGRVRVWVWGSIRFLDLVRKTIGGKMASPYVDGVGL